MKRYSFYDSSTQYITAILRVVGILIHSMSPIPIFLASLSFHSNVLLVITNSNYNCITTLRAIRGAVPRQRASKPPNGLPERPDSTRRSTPHNVQGTYRLCTVPTVRQLGERNHQGRLPTSLVSGTCSFHKGRYTFKRKARVYTSRILRSDRIRVGLSWVPGLPVHLARHNNLTSIHGKKRGLVLWA